MRAGADEVKVRNHVVAVVRAQPAGLGRDRLEPEGAAEVGAEIEREIARGVVELGDDAVVDVGDQAPADLVENALIPSGAMLGSVTVG